MDVPKHTFKITKSMMIFAVLVLSVLLSCSVSIAQAADNDPALVRAARKGDLNEVIRLLNQGVGINAKNRYDETALMAAAEGGNLDVVKLLIEKEADINAKDDFGATGLMRAAWGGNLDVVKFLIEKGLDVKARNKYGTTLLMYAAWGGKPDVAKFLIEKGVDVNAKENGPAGVGNWSVLWSFVRSYIGDKSSATMEGKGLTALEIAREKGHKEIVEYLKAHGAQE